MLKRRAPMTVTELAGYARCEQQAAFDARYGDKRSKDWNQKARAGNRAHRAQQWHAAAIGKAGDERCFVATAVFGPHAAETEALRAWRDHALTPYPAGRLIVRAYYRLGSQIAPIVQRHKVLRRSARAILKRFVKFIGARP